MEESKAGSGVGVLGVGNVNQRSPREGEFSTHP